MGVVNVTPDSFSDGGRFLEREAAIAEGLRHAAEGAAIVDVGGESTRPGSDGVDSETELARVVSVIAGIRAASPVAISIDTTKPVVARAAIEAGATMVNDVTALADPQMAALIAETGVDLCLMHMQGTPRTMQLNPTYGDVVAEVAAWLLERVDRAVAAGVPRGHIAVDPGIGFGKDLQHNLALLAATATIDRACGAPVVVGVSRKSFLGRVLGDLSRDRATASVVAGLEAVARGAWMLRVHDVESHRDALAVRYAIGGVT